jgi:hypothetical protein
MAARLGDVPWRLGLLLGGGVWIALLGLAHSAGPIDQAVFWASLIAALPIGFGWMCRCILSGKTGLDWNDERRGCSPTSAAPSQKRVIAPDNRGSGKAYIRGRKESASVSPAAAVKARSKLQRKSMGAVARAKTGPVTNINGKQRQRPRAARPRLDGRTIRPRTEGRRP